MKKIYYIGLIGLVGLISPFVSAQNQTSKPTKEIKGKVIDAATGLPAAGIRVQGYNDQSHSAMTDENGEYTLNASEYVTSIVLSAEGYNMTQQAVKLDANGKQPLCKMYSDKFTSIYSATTNGTHNKTANVKYNNNDLSIDNQIQSSLGGDLYANIRSAAPAQGVKALVQGLNSINANALPLVIVDGAIMPMQNNTESVHDGFFNNILGNIMVEDIERISVLKNGLAIYGAKGANGVIVIETKRNKSMATKIDFSAAGSYEFKPKSPNMMNAEQYKIFASELIGSTGTKGNSFKFLQTDPNYFYYDMYNNNTDWSSLVNDEAFTQNYGINVQGGDDVANYNLSVGYANGESTLKKNNFSRFNLRLNSDIVLADKLDLRFDASYSDVSRDLRDDGAQYLEMGRNGLYGIITSPSFLSLIKSPFLSPYAYDSNGNLSSFLSEADDYLSDVLSNEDWRASLANPLSILLNGEGDIKNNFGNRTINLSFIPQFRANKYLTVYEHFAFGLINTDDKTYLPLTGVPTFEVKNAGTANNVSKTLTGHQIDLMSDTYATYNRRFGSHWLNVRGGVRYINSSYELKTFTGYNSGNDKTPSLGGSYLKNYGQEDKSIDINYYLSSDYNYLEKYYLTAGISMNGNSKFGKDAADGIRISNYAWGFFPSVNAAWVVSNENWFKVKFIDYLKLNAGFDLTGNDNLDSKANRTYFVAGKVLGNAVGLTLGNIGNTKLQWETTARLNLGVQLAALSNRLNFGFNFFHGNTYNLLTLNSLSYLTGLDEIWTNGGRMTNVGFDANIQAKLINQQDWKWELGATMGHYKNTVKTLPSKNNFIISNLYGANILTTVGQAANVFYGYKTNGVFNTKQAAEEAGLYLRSSSGERQYFEAGDMRFVDLNNDHEINDKDMTVIGDPNPDLYGNIFTNLSYKKLTLSINCKYSLGNDIYNFQRSVLEGGSNFYNQTTNMLRRWTHEGQQTDVPRATYLDPMGNSRFSDRWIEDGSYLKIANITLSYDVPIQNTYIQGLTIWGSANNLVTFTKYLGSDPEFSCTNSIIGMGIDRGLVGAGRSFSLGLKLNL